MIDLTLGQWISLALALAGLIALGWAELRDQHTDDEF